MPVCGRNLDLRLHVPHPFIRVRWNPMASKRPVHSLLYGDVVFLYCKTGGYVFSEVSRWALHEL